MNRLILTLTAIALGAGLGASGYHLLFATGSTSSQEESQPLYWVAPMDPNYRRDQPGQSPMGMDLIPVYEEGVGSKDSPGTVQISPEVENNLGVRTARVEIKPLHSRIETVGYVGFNEDELVHLHPRVEGWLEKLYVRAEGERVQQGEPLFAIYSPALVNAQEELLMALDRNNTKLIRSAKERLLALQVPASLLTQLEKNRKVSRAVTVYAPKSGVVANLNVREGFFATPGKNILSIGPLDEVWVTAEVFEHQMARVQEGDSVMMSLESLPGELWRGKVDYIYPMLDPTNRTARVRVRFKNQQQQLKPNMFAQVSIQLKAESNSLIVPKEAVIRTGHQNRVVLALGEGKFKSVAVTLGQFTQSEVEVLKGLEAGDRIVTSAQFLLDSESSIHSDFSRMSIDNPSTPASVWAEGIVTEQNRLNRIVTVDHKPIEAWQWPQMVMEFEVADGVNIDELQPGTAMHFEITEVSQGYRIIGTHLIKQESETPQDTDHSQHQNMAPSQHQDIDHSQHQNMDHSQHQNMDHSQHQQHGETE